MNDFILFYDENLQQPVNDPIDLGKLKAGDSKKYTFYIYNSTVFPYEELKYSFDKNDVVVLIAPEKLEEKRSDKLVIEWKPSIDIKQGLKTTLKIEGYQVLS